MTTDRNVIIKKERKAGATFNFIAKVWGISETRVRQIYFNKRTAPEVLSSLGTEKCRVDRPLSMI